MNNADCKDCIFFFPARRISNALRKEVRSIAETTECDWEFHDHGSILGRIELPTYVVEGLHMDLSEAFAKLERDLEALRESEERNYLRFYTEPSVGWPANASPLLIDHCRQGGGVYAHEIKNADGNCRSKYPPRGILGVNDIFYLRRAINENFGQGCINCKHRLKPEAVQINRNPDLDLWRRTVFVARDHGSPVFEVDEVERDLKLQEERGRLGRASIVAELRYELEQVVACGGIFDEQPRTLNSCQKWGQGYALCAVFNDRSACPHFELAKPDS